MTGWVSWRTLREGAADGARVALVHGLEDSWSSWRPLAERLDPRCWVYALDLPWRVGNDYRWRESASPAGWLGAGLDGLDDTLDLIVAHSVGANAALELLAAGDPRMPGGAVLICPLYRSPHTAVTEDMFDRARVGFEAYVRDGVLARMAPRASTVAPEVQECIATAALERVGPGGLHTVYERLAASGELPLETVPARVVVLDCGEEPGLAAAQQLAGRIPLGTATVDRAFGGCCHLRRPESVAARVRALVEVVAQAPVPGVAIGV